MFTPILCPACTAIVIVPDFSDSFGAYPRLCPCCGVDVSEAPTSNESELVRVPARRKDAA